MNEADISIAQVTSVFASDLGMLKPKSFFHEDLEPPEEIVWCF